MPAARCRRSVLRALFRSPPRSPSRSPNRFARVPKSCSTPPQETLNLGLLRTTLAATCTTAVVFGGVDAQRKHRRKRPSGSRVATSLSGPCSQKPPGDATHKTSSVGFASGHRRQRSGEVALVGLASHSPALR
eukprot:5185441-Pyramimonas_sp.AAC.1